MTQDLDVYLEKERSKLDKDKWVFDRQFKAMKNLPNRREWQEIDGLKAEIKTLNEDIKKKDSRNKLATERVKKQVNESREKNFELLGERDAILHLVN